MDLVPPFDILGLPPAFDLDAKALEAAYFQEQRRFHPDRFVARPEAERAEALRRSVDINEAYRTLKEPLSRAQALLLAQGIRVGTDNDTIKPSAALLMESMVWHEAVEEAQTEPQLSVEEERLQAAYCDCMARISALYREAQYESMAQAVLSFIYVLKAKEAASLKRARLARAGT